MPVRTITVTSNVSFNSISWHATRFDGWALSNAYGTDIRTWQDTTGAAVFYPATSSPLYGLSDVSFTVLSPPAYTGVVLPAEGLYEVTAQVSVTTPDYINLPRNGAPTTTGTTEMYPGDTYDFHLFWYDAAILTAYHFRGGSSNYPSAVAPTISAAYTQVVEGRRITLTDSGSSSTYGIRMLGWKVLKGTTLYNPQIDPGGSFGRADWSAIGSPASVGLALEDGYTSYLHAIDNRGYVAEATKRLITTGPGSQMNVPQTNQRIVAYMDTSTISTRADLKAVSALGSGTIPTSGAVSLFTTASNQYVFMHSPYQRGTRIGYVYTILNYSGGGSNTYTTALIESTNYGQTWPGGNIVSLVSNWTLVGELFHEPTQTLILLGRNTSGTVQRLGVQFNGTSRVLSSVVNVSGLPSSIPWLGLSAQGTLLDATVQNGTDLEHYQSSDLGFSWTNIP